MTIFLRPFSPHALALAAAMLATTAATAQSVTGAPATAAPGTTTRTAGTSPGSAAVPVFVITGNPLGRADPAAPLSVLDGTELLLRRSASLGQTLDGLPGVSATGFGPNSSRPVIRGLDGDRVRLLENGGASVDASSLSFDHAVAVDPLVFERVEVLRGPAALLYGGNATGGVVNQIDGRIPQAQRSGLGGRAEVRLGGAASERAGAAVLQGGAGEFAWQVDAFGRDTDDTRTPLYTPLADDEALASSRRIRNSAAQAQGGAVGGGWVGRDGRLGASLETYRHHYGVTVEPDVLIRMRRERAALAGQWTALPGPLASLDWQASRTRYSHDEVEGDGEIGTTFGHRGSEMRLALRHKPLDGLGGAEGVLGLQVESATASALGEEAFVPGTRTRSQALFLLESWRLGALTLSAGLRAERVRVASDGDLEGHHDHEHEDDHDDHDDHEDEGFGPPMQRHFSPRSALLSASWPAGGGWQFSGTLGSTQRAPAYYELYANGVHLATASYERGDPTLRTESSRHLEGGLSWSGQGHSLRASLFRTRFSRFIALDASGRRIEVEDHHGHGGDHDHEDEEDEPETVPELVFRSVPARTQGLELEGRWQLMQRPWALVLTGGLDIVRGLNLDTRQALPRLAPQRLRLGLEASQGPWTVAAQWRRSAAQNRVPDTDTATAGFSVLDLSASHQSRWAGRDALWFLRLANVGNTLGFNAGAVASVRGLSPTPGRALSGGVQMRF